MLLALEAVNFLIFGFHGGNRYMRKINRVDLEITKRNSKRAR
jgi:hypothetical protein